MWSRLIMNPAQGARLLAERNIMLHELCCHIPQLELMTAKQSREKPSLVVKSLRFEDVYTFELGFLEDHLG